MFTADSNILDELSYDFVKGYIKLHKKEIPRLQKLYNYYIGKQDILTREKDTEVPNNKIVCNHAKTIADTATGYFIGNSISYVGTGAEKLKEWFQITDIDSVDAKLAENAGIYGRAYELVNMSQDEKPTPKSYVISPFNTFVVYDDTVEHNPLLGVYYYPVNNDKNELIGYKVTVSSSKLITVYETDRSLSLKSEISREQNVFADVPIIEYSNNDVQQGDFEQVISLIDAYNILMSDRVNDKEQFVDAILLIINALLGDSEEEDSQVYKALKQNKLLALPSESDARYLTRTFDESGVEILRKALEEDIHKFANVPCMSDENFVGNASGVAMEYKLLGLEMITKIKERHFKAGIKKRIKLYSTINNIKGGVNNIEIEPVFSRGLPKNLVELANIVSQLSDVVPLETLLSLLPFIKDPKEAVELLKKQKEENSQIQKDSFGIVRNASPDGGEDDEE